MVVQSKKAQFLLLFFSLAFALSLGIVGYIFVQKAPSAAGEEGKLYAELLLYLSILFAVLLAALHGFMFIRNKNILKELDKIIEMSAYNNFSPVESLRRLSTIGEKIGQIYKNVSFISEKRALKISTLHNLTQLLLNNIALPVIVTDVRGAVIYLSKQFREKYPEQSGLSSTSVVNFIPEFKIQRVLDHFDKNFSTVETKLGRTELTVYPVRNREFEVANLVFVIGKGSLVQEETVEKKLNKPQQEQERRGLFSKLVGKRYKGNG